MQEIPQTYQVETVEQLRAIADRLRIRIVDLLERQPLTVAQLAQRLGLPHAKVHYHVRELEEVGLVVLVETRPKGGILEKYYRAVAKEIHIAPTVLHSIPPDESLAAVTEFLQNISHGALQAFSRELDSEKTGPEMSMLGSYMLHLTRDEGRALVRDIQALIKPFEQPRGTEGEREYTLATLLYREEEIADGAGDDDEQPLERE